MRRLVATALLTPALLGSICPPAVAATEDAVPYRVETCSTTPNGRLLCVVDHGVLTTTVDAAGGDHFIFNGQATTTLTEPSGEEVYRISNDRHFVSHAQADGTQVTQAVSRYTTSVAGETCTFRVGYAVVNGELRHENFDFTCR